MRWAELLARQAERSDRHQWTDVATGIVVTEIVLGIAGAVAGVVVGAVFKIAQAIIFGIIVALVFGVAAAVVLNGALQLGGTVFPGEA